MQRLKTRPQFQAVLTGCILSRTPHFALHCIKLDVASLLADKPLFGIRCVWIGAMVPKRWAKRAVTRNTIKRQIYALSQDFESEMLPAAHVVRLRAGFDKARFVSASSDALKAFVRTELLQLFAAGCAASGRGVE